MRLSRSSGLLMPASAILLPGIFFLGALRNARNSSGVQTRPSSPAFHRGRVSIVRHAARRAADNPVKLRADPVFSALTDGVTGGTPLEDGLALGNIALRKSRNGACGKHCRRDDCYFAHRVILVLPLEYDPSTEADGSAIFFRSCPRQACPSCRERDPRSHRESRHRRELPWRRSSR